MPSFYVREMLPSQVSGYKWQSYQSVTQLTSRRSHTVTFTISGHGFPGLIWTEVLPMTPVMVTTRIRPGKVTGW